MKAIVCFLVFFWAGACAVNIDTVTIPPSQAIIYQKDDYYLTRNYTDQYHTQFRYFLFNNRDNLTDTVMGGDFEIKGAVIRNDTAYYLCFNYFEKPKQEFSHFSFCLVRSLISPKTLIDTILLIDSISDRYRTGMDYFNLFENTLYVFYGTNLVLVGQDTKNVVIRQTTGYSHYQAVDSLLYCATGDTLSTCKLNLFPEFAINTQYVFPKTIYGFSSVANSDSIAAVTADGAAFYSLATSSPTRISVFYPFPSLLWKCSLLNGNLWFSAGDIPTFVGYYNFQSQTRNDLSQISDESKVVFGEKEIAVLIDSTKVVLYSDTSRISSIVKNQKTIIEENSWLMPNPLSANQDLSFNLPYQNVSIDVFDMAGKVILRSTPRNASRVTINLPCNMSGVYLVRVKTEKHIIHSKMFSIIK